MKYHTTFCPNCHHTEEIMRGGRYAGYGSKLRTCPICGTKYINKDYIEMAFEGIPTADDKPCSPGPIILGLFFGCGSFFLHYSGPKEDQWIFWIAVALAGICLIITLSELLGWKKRKEEIAKEYAASEQRMKNKEYVRILVENGINVPLRYRE